jgi:hypothetical protein
VLLFAIAAPVYIILLSIQFEPTVSASDFAYVAIELGLIVIEIFADQQQWGKSGLEVGLRSMIMLILSVSQITKPPRRSIKHQQSFHRASSRSILTEVSLRLAYGLTADIQTLPQSNQSGSSSISGDVMPPRSCSTGLLSARLF